MAIEIERGREGEKVVERNTADGGGGGNKTVYYGKVVSDVFTGVWSGVVLLSKGSHDAIY